MAKKDQVVSLLLSALVLASGFIVLSQRNQINQLKEQNTLLLNQYNSVVQENNENQQNLEEKIVYETLKIALVEEKIPTFNSLTLHTREIIVSSENIEEIKVPTQIGEYRLHKLTPEEIEAIRESEGAFLYLLFTKFEPDPDSSQVNIQTAGLFDSVGGLTISFQQRGTIYGGWIS